MAIRKIEAALAIAENLRSNPNVHFIQNNNTMNMLQLNRRVWEILLHTPKTSNSSQKTRPQSPSLIQFSQILLTYLILAQEKKEKINKFRDEMRWLSGFKIYNTWAETKDCCILAELRLPLLGVELWLLLGLELWLEEAGEAEGVKEKERDLWQDKKIDRYIDR